MYITELKGQWTAWAFPLQKSPVATYLNENEFPYLEGAPDKYRIASNKMPRAAEFFHDANMASFEKSLRGDDGKGEIPGSPPAYLFMYNYTGYEHLTTEHFQTHKPTMPADNKSASKQVEYEAESTAEDLFDTFREALVADTISDFIEYCSSKTPPVFLPILTLSNMVDAGLLKRNPLVLEQLAQYEAGAPPAPPAPPAALPAC